MLIYEGLKVYKLSNLIIYEYEVVSFTKTKVRLKNNSTIKKGKAPLINTNYDLFQANYMLNKIPLLREVLLRLETYIEEVAVEINEYELKCILNKYKYKDES